MFNPQNNKIKILKTLIYSDIFDYPLTIEDIHRFLISDKKEEIKEIRKNLQALKKIIAEENGFYCFLNKKEIVEKRIIREKISCKKIIFTNKIASYLAFIPTVYLIGISGALAMKNSDEKDDIDLFIIAKENTLWTTRLFILLFLQFLGVLRRRNEKNLKNKICLNMLVDENFMSLPKTKRDLYNAHEVVQLLPIFERKNTYSRFINANFWINHFLANAFEYQTMQKNRLIDKESFVYRILYSILSSSILERLSKKIQLWYIKKHKTKEMITDNLLAFHPLDYKDMVLSLYKKRVKKYAKI